MHALRTIVFFAVFVFVVLVASIADAASLILQWDPPTDGQTVGYVVLYGTASGVYSVSTDVGSVTSHRIDGLASDTQYFFSIRAYNGLGELSGMADEVWGTTGGAGAPGPSAPRPPTTPVGRAGPTAVTAGLDARGFVAVSWAAVGGTPVGYRVEVGSAPGQTTYSAFTTDLHVVFDLTGLAAPAYFIRVRAVTATTVTAPSDEVMISAAGDRREVEPPPIASGGECPAPRAPLQFGASANGSMVHLTWQPGIGQTPTGYLLQVGSAAGRWTQTAHLGPTTELVATTGDGTYALRLVAVNHCGASVWGAETVLHVASSAPLPGPPQRLSRQLSGDLLTLSWDAPATGAPATRYLIEATTPFGPFAYDTGNPATVFTNRNTPPGQYVVTVRAGNAAGFGPPSAAVTVRIP
jgi:hypothetical protein